MSYVVSGLPLEPFRPLFGLSEADLSARGVIRMTADASPGFPCRITLRDAEPGQTLLLLNHEHLAVDTPYRSRHAIFVNEAATETLRYENEIPPVLAVRPHISLRAFDEAGMMLDGGVSPGAELEPLIERFLELDQAAYLHAHYAGRGCYAARIDRL